MKTVMGVQLLFRGGEYKRGRKKGREREERDDIQANPAIANAALLVNTHRNPSTSLLLSLFSATVIL